MPLALLNAARSVALARSTHEVARATDESVQRRKERCGTVVEW